MDKVFRISAYYPTYCAELIDWSVGLTLPATSYEITDMLERMGGKDIDRVSCQIEESYKGACLADVIEGNISIRELNAIARKISELEEHQEAALEGLVKMECGDLNSHRLLYRKILQLIENVDLCQIVSEARNDAQLGRLYVENTFSSVLDELPEEVFQLLDFEKTGRERREAEGGVYTSSGYAVCLNALKEPDQEPDLDLEKPPYTILLEIRNKEAESGPWLHIELPLFREKLAELQERLPCEEYQYHCVDCAIPFFREYINQEGVDLQDIGLFSQRMERAQELGLLAKYKAVLQATGCQDVKRAAELGHIQTLKEYQLIPPEPETELERSALYAKMWLQKKLGMNGEALFGQNLEELGRCLMERHHVESTDYGLIQRADGGPIQRFHQKIEPNSMEMTM